MLLANVFLDTAELGVATEIIDRSKMVKVKLRSVRSLPLKSIFVRSICYEASLTHNPIEKEYNKKKAEFTFTFSLSLN